MQATRLQAQARDFCRAWVGEEQPQLELGGGRGALVTKSNQTFFVPARAPLGHALIDGAPCRPPISKH